MPRLNIDMFDNEPSVGDHIKVLGKIKSISDDGMVEASYDTVTVVDKKSRKRRDNNDDSNDDMDETDMIVTDQADDPNSLDAALSQAFAKNR